MTFSVSTTQPYNKRLTRDRAPSLNSVTRRETVIGGDPETLELILIKHVKLAIWERTLPICLTNWLGQLKPDQLPNFRILARSSKLNKILKALLESCGTPDNDMRRILVEDIEYLVSRFATITRSDCVDIRLETITHDACWKFHQDLVDVRLLSTYLGPATQWVKPDNSKYALRDQNQFAGQIENMGTSDVSIFKGNCEENCDGIVHRSPPINSSGQTRLLLCLNKQTATSPPLIG